MIRIIYKAAVVLFFMALCSGSIVAKTHEAKRTVAVVVDEITYSKIGEDVDAYVKSVSNAGREGVLIVDKWFSPDSIKSALLELYNGRNLEGAVFVGDIPIPMIRDAQHMTTAFKMDQKSKMEWSSVPSDRFYDDFDLKFKFIKQDEQKRLLFYYSLEADGAQHIDCDIYSSRIKAPEGENKYALISDFLKKAVAAKENVKSMNKVLHFAGHGYNSESMNARIDEAIALTEHFQFLRDNEGKLDYIDYTFDKFIKKRLMAAVADKSLDLAILHHHGGDDAQYLNGAPYEDDPAGWIGLARNYFRGKVRDAEDTVATKKRFKAKFDIPDSWMADAFDADKVLEDSLFSAGKDIVIADMEGYASGAKMVILDACYNGSFCNDDYMAAHYIFNPGNTVVVKANSVNTLQDTWTTELIGLLNWGVCAGNWTKGQMTLESHLFGDATFEFAPQNLGYFNKKGFDADAIINSKKHDIKYWKNVLQAPVEDELVCDFKSLAIKMLAQNNAISGKELLDIQKNSKSRVLRLAAFNANMKMADENFVEAMIMGLGDTYELLQRLSAKYAARNYSSQLIPTIVATLADPTTPSRVIFQIQSGSAGYDTEAIVAEMERQNAESPYWDGEKAFSRLVRIVSRNGNELVKELKEADNGELSTKKLKMLVKGRRNGCEPQAVKTIVGIIENSADAELRQIAAEVLGWYEYSAIKSEVLSECERLYAKENDNAVKSEILKAINRLKNR